MDMVGGIFGLAITIGLGAAWLWVWIPRAKKYVCRMGTIRMGVTFRRPNFHTVWEKIVEGVKRFIEGTKRFAREYPWDAVNFCLWFFVLACGHFSWDFLPRAVQVIPWGKELATLWVTVFCMRLVMFCKKSAETISPSIGMFLLLAYIAVVSLPFILSLLVRLSHGLFYLVLVMAFGFFLLYNTFWQIICRIQSMVFRLFYGYSCLSLLLLYSAGCFYIYAVYVNALQGHLTAPLTYNDILAGIAGEVHALVTISFPDSFIKDGKFHWFYALEIFVAGAGALAFLNMKTLVSVCDKARDGVDIEMGKGAKQTIDGSTANHGAC